MAPSTALTTSRFPDTTQSPTSSSLVSPSSGANDAIINIVFGILACIVGVITIWQSYRAWPYWLYAPRHSRTNANATASSDNELELQPRPGTHNDAGALPHIPSHAVSGMIQPPEARPTSVPHGQQLISNPQAGDNPIHGSHFPSTSDNGVAFGA